MGFYIFFEKQVWKAKENYNSLTFSVTELTCEEREYGRFVIE
jgi:hypothetical protein